MTNRKIRQQGWSGARRGFTLVEILMVLMFIAIVLRLSLPRLDMARYRADAITQMVRTTIQQGQRTALLRQHDVLVSIDTAGQRLRVIWDANNDGLASTGERVYWRSLENPNRFSVPSKGVSGTVSKSVVGSSLITMDGYPTFKFHRDGSSSTDVEIYIRSAKHRGSEPNRAIVLIRATGRCEWYREGGNGTWRLATL